MASHSLVRRGHPIEFVDGDEIEGYRVAEGGELFRDGLQLVFGEVGRFPLFGERAAGLDHLGLAKLEVPSFGKLEDLGSVSVVDIGGKGCETLRAD